MTTRAAGLAACLLATLGLAGCVSRGVIAARIEPGAAPSAGAATGDQGSTAPDPAIEIAWQSEAFGNGGTMTLALPGGETFAGRYFEMRSSAASYGFGFGVGPWGWGGPWAGGGMGWYGAWGPWGPWGAWPWGGPEFTTFYSGRVIATLFGDRGGALRCRFQLANPGGGLGGGGVGECELADGRKIVAAF